MKDLLTGQGHPGQRRHPGSRRRHRPGRRPRGRHPGPRRAQRRARRAGRRRADRRGRRGQLRAGRHHRCGPGRRRGAGRPWSRHGRIDSLVNSAGLTTRGTLLDTTEELFDQHIAVNLKAPFFLMQAAVADMRQRGAARNDRQHHLHRLPRWSVVPRAVRRREGRPRRADPQRGARAPLGPDPDQRAEHRLVGHRRREPHPAPVPRRRRGLAGAGRRGPADGQARPGRRDRRLRRVPALRPQRRRHRVRHRLGPERHRRSR